VTKYVLFPFFEALLSVSNKLILLSCINNYFENFRTSHRWGLGKRTCERRWSWGWLLCRRTQI